MSDNVTKADLDRALSNYATKADLQFALNGAVQTIITELGVRFGEVNHRLDRIDATLVSHGRQISTGARSIADLTGWMGKADEDYTRVLAELTDLKLRVEKLEGK